MRTRPVAAGLTAALLVVAAACGGGDGDGTLPDRSTTSSSPDSADSTTTTGPPLTTTTRPPITTTTRPPITTTTRAPLTTTTAPATTTTAASAPNTEDEVAAPAADEGAEDDATDWPWALLLVPLAGLIGYLVWRRRRPVATWDLQASQLADEIDAAGRSVLLGPELTPDLWGNALAHSTQVRSEVQRVSDHAPTPAARQAVQESAEALRLSEVQANTARTTPGTDLTTAAAQLSAATERLRAMARAADRKR